MAVKVKGVLMNLVNTENAKLVCHLSILIFHGERLRGKTLRPY